MNHNGKVKPIHPRPEGRGLLGNLDKTFFLKYNEYIMKLVVDIISDTHNQHSKLLMPGGELLIHCGDATMSGKLPEVTGFLSWFAEQPYKYKIFVPGNHDWLFEQQPAFCADECKNRGIILLNDTSIVIEGLKIHGSAITPFFLDWAFNRHRGEDIQNHWNLIPKNTQILITHGPPFGILDKTTRGTLVGCKNLLATIKTLPHLKLHAFGHIHECIGMVEKDSVKFVNAAMLDDQYNLQANRPIQIILD